MSIKTKETKLIRETWQRLEWAFESSRDDYISELLRIAVEESKSHDRYRGGSIERGISVNTEAKYFALKRIWMYWRRSNGFIEEGNSIPEVNSYLYTQKSCFHAAALVLDEQTRPSIQKFMDAESTHNLQLIVSWDYSDLIQSDDRRKGYHRSPVAA